MTVEDVFFKLNRVHRIVIVGIICVLALVLFVVFVISDKRKSIAKTEKEIGRLKLAIVNQENTLKKKPILLKQLKALRVELRGMVASLPQKQEIEMLIRKITDLATQSALVQQKFVPGREKVNRKLYYARIPFSLTVQGDYQKQGNFFASLHDLPRIVNVPSVSFSRTGGVSERERALSRKMGLVNLQANINAVTYRRLSPEEIKRIDAAKKQGAKRGRKRRRR